MNVVKVGNVHFYDISSEKTQWRRKVKNVGEAENASQSLSPSASQSPSPSAPQSLSPPVPQSGPSAPSSESKSW